MTKTLGCLLALVLALLLVAGLLVFWGMGVYNGLVDTEQAVEAQWAQVENVYQRRADLVPNLVATVRGAADFEQETLQAVVEARSRVGSIQAGADLLENPEAFARFEAAQDQLSSALSRLLVVVEQYPQIQATQAFRDLMVQLEGTENRIAVERRRYNQVAQDLNSRIRRVPAAWLIDALGWSFEEKPYFQAQAGAEEVPAVEF